MRKELLAPAPSLLQVKALWAWQVTFITSLPGATVKDVVGLIIPEARNDDEGVIDEPRLAFHLFKTICGKRYLQ